MTNGYELLPIGVAFCTGKSEEDAINKFVAERDDVSREQIKEIEPHDGAIGRAIGRYKIRYWRANETKLPYGNVVLMRDACSECGKTTYRAKTGRPRHYCSDYCRLRAFRRRKREQDIGRAQEEGSA